MQGTGAQDNPYLVTTEDELLGILKVNRKSEIIDSIYISLQNDLDFNDYERNDIEDKIYWYYINFNGNNHKIYNFFGRIDIFKYSQFVSGFPYTNIIENTTFQGQKKLPYNIKTASEFKKYMIPTKSKTSDYNIEDNGATYLNIIDDLDFNQAEFWNVEPMSIYNVVVEGNGHKFKNIYVKNMILFDIGSSTSYGSWGLTKFFNCIFEGVMIRTNTSDSYITRFINKSNTNSMLIVNCEFRFKLYEMSSPKSCPCVLRANENSGKSTIVNCVFNLEINMSATVIDGVTSESGPISIGGSNSNTNFINNEIYANYKISNQNVKQSKTYEYKLNYMPNRGGEISNNAIFLDLDFSKMVFADNIEDAMIMFTMHDEGNTNICYNSTVLKSLKLPEKKSEDQVFPYIKIRENGHSSTGNISQASIFCNLTQYQVNNLEKSGSSLQRDKLNLQSISESLVLTESQIKNTAYLKSIGFPIV